MSLCPLSPGFPTEGLAVLLDRERQKERERESLIDLSRRLEPDTISTPYIDI